LQIHRRGDRLLFQQASKYLDMFLRDAARDNQRNEILVSYDAVDFATHGSVFFAPRRLHVLGRSQVVEKRPKLANRATTAPQIPRFPQIPQILESGGIPLAPFGFERPAPRMAEPLRFNVKRLNARIQ
jgi:hypothetical protein